MEDFSADLSLLDSLGITININELPSTAECRKVGRWLYGGNWLRRLWMRHVYRRIFPQHYIDAWWNHEMLKAQMQSEFMNKILGDTLIPHKAPA